jgi:hypothetical protein
MMGAARVTAGAPVAVSLAWPRVFHQSAAAARRIKAIATQSPILRGFLGAERMISGAGGTRWTAGPEAALGLEALLM